MMVMNGVDFIRNFNLNGFAVEGKEMNFTLKCAFDYFLHDFDLLSTFNH
jgi:hypothetical protein